MAEQLLMGFGQGMSLRSLCVWLKGLGLPTGSLSTLQRLIREKALELSLRRQRSIPPGRFVALVADGSG